MKSLILAGAAALALTGTAIAQAPGAPAGRPQGNILRADATAMVDQLFARVDSNRDGRITRDEMQAARQQFAQSRPGAGAEAQAPAGGRGPMGMPSGPGFDGTITLEQARSMALERFDRMDGDRDGIVTPDERQAARESMNRMMEEGMGGARPRTKGRR